MTDSRPHQDQDARVRPRGAAGAWRGGTSTLVTLAIVFFGLTILASVLTQYGRGWIGVATMVAGLLVAWLLAVFVTSKGTASDRDEES
jgi:CHASE2 domain-containing sensor protein